MGRIAASFVLVGALALASYLQNSQLPIYKSRYSNSKSISKWSLGSIPVSTLQEESHVFKLSANETAAVLPDGYQGIHRLSGAEAIEHGIREQTEWMNSLIRPLVPDTLWNSLPRFGQSWLRNWVFAVIVYFGLGFSWAYYIYQCFGYYLFPKNNMPSWGDMGEQMQVSFVALPLYSLLPAITEEVCERGWTLAYARVADVGLARYMAYLFLYMAFVEFGVYWMHRGLHDVHIGYKLLHNVHHKYNKEHTMSPFAGLAFHPIDGILQALPYTLALCVVPMHFLTHEILLFATAFWTANIHDNIHGNVLPIMGAGYHTIHHTSYKHNYGHYFVIMDWLFGTMITPEEWEDRTAGIKAAVKGRSAAAAS